MKQLIVLVFALVLSVSGVSAQGYYTGAELNNYTSNPDRLVVMKTKQGVIKIQLFDKIAPKHVANFIKNVNAGFYDGLTFHRVIPGFMIQGGDPNSKDDDFSNDGFGRPDLEKVPAEFSKLKHERGILSAARTADPNSATTQFFLMHQYNSQLDGQYSIFGQVVEGMDVVDKIVMLPNKNPAGSANGANPGKAAEITKATVVEGKMKATPVVAKTKNDKSKSVKSADKKENKAIEKAAKKNAK
jgi:cyclophilin family peptidyl-prolyl cis-trans isomerase